MAGWLSGLEKGDETEDDNNTKEQVVERDGDAVGCGLLVFHVPKVATRMD